MPEKTIKIEDLKNVVEIYSNWDNIAKVKYYGLLVRMKMREKITG